MNYRIIRGMIAAILLTWSIAVIFPTRAYGATVSSGTVKVSSGNVRASASTSSAVSFCVSSGNEVAILAEEKGKDGNTWFKVAVGSSVGFIRSDLVSKTDKKINVSDSLVSAAKTSPAAQTTATAQTAATAQTTATTQTNATAAATPQAATAAATTTAGATGGSTGTVKGTWVRMRNNASLNSGVVTYLNSGDVVSILAEGKASDGQIWYQVRTKDQTGFIRSDLISKAEQSAQGSETQATATTTATAAEAATTATTAAAATTDQTAASATPAAGGASSADVVTKTVEPGTGYVKGVNVRVRSVAGTTGDIVGTVSAGCELKLLGVEKSADRDWVKIETTVQGQSVNGYIARDYVMVTKEVKEITQTSHTIIGNDTKTTEGTQAQTDGERTVSDNGGETKGNDKDDGEKKENNTGPKQMTASVKGVGVRIRQTPVEGNVVCQLSSGHPLTVKKETSGSDNCTWYQVSFSYLGSEREGYVRSDLVTMMESSQAEAPAGDEEFEKSIAALPDGYRNAIRSLHAKHPKWKFEAVDTGLEWSAALSAESAAGKNLVSKNSITSWKSTAPQAYDQAKNEWYTFDGGSWASASGELIAYYMDPRNFLNDSGIYMFEKLDYSESQKTGSVSKMLAGTFMSGDFTDSDGQTYNYAELFKKIGELTGVSPYLLAGRVLQEQGIKGDKESISGTVEGYEGYYNYFNVGASAYSGRTAPVNGLIYASEKDDDLARPWDTRAKSIYGGARYLADRFVSKGQNTLYFQKFNVIGGENSLYSHQYMTNIQAASSESSRLQLAYIGDDEVLTFRIPYYEGMPESACAKPTSDSDPNTYLASLEIEGGELDPEFTGSTDKYTLKINPDRDSVEISATPVSSKSSVGGTGTVSIGDDTDKLYVSCKAQNGSVRTYTISISR